MTENSCNLLELRMDGCQGMRKWGGIISAASSDKTYS